MLIRVAAGLIALVVVVSPSGMIEGFIGEGPVEAEIVRLIAAAILVLSVFSLAARARKVAVPRSTQFNAVVGLSLLAVGLAGRQMVLTFFAFPFLVGSMLATGMILAESWREEVLRSYRRRYR